MSIVHSFHIYLCKSNFATLKLGELSSWSYSFAVRDLTICNNCRVPWLIFLVWVRAQGHYAKLLSQAKLGGKKRKTRDHGQEEGKVSDKSTIFAARNITREHVWIITCAIKEGRVRNKYFYSGLTPDVISEIFDVALCLFNAMLCLWPVFCTF